MQIVHPHLRLDHSFIQSAMPSNKMYVTSSITEWMDSKPNYDVSTRASYHFLLAVHELTCDAHVRSTGIVP